MFFGVFIINKKIIITQAGFNSSSIFLFIVPSKADKVQFNSFNHKKVSLLPESNISVPLIAFLLRRLL